MVKFNVLSKQCPVCDSRAVVQAESGKRMKQPTHRCEKCGVQLKTVFTSHAFWAIPTGVISLGAMYLVITWLQQSHIATSIVRAGLIGGVSAFSYSVTANVMLRGVVFAPWKSGHAEA